MCGVAGIAGSADPADSAVVGRMVEALRHRGPDHQAVAVLPGGACFGHARLSIIELSAAGHQPMVDLGGRYAITFNGEIYNFRALRRELESDFAFRGGSDTEVALNAFVRWGPAAFDRFDGMFALALWDAHARTLHLARDRFGEKPLFYTLLGGRLTFASEASALLVDPRIAAAVTPSIAAQNHYLALGYVLNPLTAWREIACLPPASRMEYREGAVRALERYWDYRRCFVAGTRARPDDAAEELRACLSEAVRSRLESDVPVGAFLSGGLDSSGVVAMARRFVPGELHTFTVRFDESSYDESPDARRVARHVGTVHHEDAVTGPYRERVDLAIDRYDQPLSDTSLVPMVAVAEAAARHVKVVLSGDGADEVFAGYPTYVADAIVRGLEVVPPSLRRLGGRLLAGVRARNDQKAGLRFKLAQLGRGIAQPPWRAHYAWRELHGEEERIALLGRQHAEEVRATDPAQVFRAHWDDADGLDWLSRMLYVDAKTWLVDDILVKVDRATMAFSLESRTPYLARAVVELAGSLPAALKLRRGRGKLVLRRALAPLLPAATLRKRKAGFAAPLNTWLGHDGSENEYRYFNRYVAARRGIPIAGGAATHGAGAAVLAGAG